MANVIEPSVLRQKRIAFFTDDPGEGGVAIYVNAMLCALARDGLDVTCIQSKNDGPLQQAQRELGVRHHWLPFQTRLDHERAATGVNDAEEVFSAVKPDVVVFANCVPASNVAAKTAAIQRGFPFIVVEGGAYKVGTIDPQTEWYLRQIAEAYANAKAVIAVSQDNLDLLHRYFGLPAGKGQVIYPGRPPEYFRAPDVAVRNAMRTEWGAASEDIVCLTAARLEFDKGWDCMLAVLDQARAKSVWQHLHFVWAGAGSKESIIRQAVEKSGMTDRVHVLGHRWDMVNLLDASDVFILPSRREGMPLTIMEAMAKALPVIASGVNGIPEELGPTGCLVSSPGSEPRKTASEIISGLERWVADPDLRRKTGYAGKVRAESMFREERMVEQTKRVIERALLPAGE